MNLRNITMLMFETINRHLLHVLDLDSSNHAHPNAEFCINVKS
jgi:hypothetical protein